MRGRANLPLPLGNSTPLVPNYPLSYSVTLSPSSPNPCPTGVHHQYTLSYKGARSVHSVLQGCTISTLCPTGAHYQYTLSYRGAPSVHCPTGAHHQYTVLQGRTISTFCPTGAHHQYTLSYRGAPSVHSVLQGRTISTLSHPPSPNPWDQQEAGSTEKACRSVPLSTALDTHSL